MTHDDFRECLSRLGLTQGGAGRFLGTDERTVRRWATGGSPIPRSVELALLLTERVGMDVAKAM